ncbi:MAG: hypothetical protein EOO65_00685 [Methanosarcinales archaeon]|nr:MAG: hypothetical protein EOO65_00685 [Methanosarcinales archaeon]
MSSLAIWQQQFVDLKQLVANVTDNADSLELAHPKFEGLEMLEVRTLVHVVCVRGAVVIRCARLHAPARACCACRLT